MEREMWISDGCFLETNPGYLFPITRQPRPYKDIKKGAHQPWSPISILDLLNSSSQDEFSFAPLGTPDFSFVNFPSSQTMDQPPATDIFPPFPVQDHQCVARLTPQPSGRCITCKTKKQDYGHCNRQLNNYLVFHCRACSQWYCGLCYHKANPDRAGEEKCANPDCGPVLYPDQIQSHEWFPSIEKKKGDLSTGGLSTSSSSSSASSGLRFEPYEKPPPPPRSQTPPAAAPTSAVPPPIPSAPPAPGPIVSPPVNPVNPMNDPWAIAIQDLQAVYERLRSELLEIKQQNAAEAEFWKKKYESLKNKIQSSLED